MADISRFIRSNVDAIAAAWCEAARALPHEQDLPGLVLLDHMPLVLEDLAKWLETDDRRGFTYNAHDHSLQRFRNGVPLVEVVAEYGMLRRIIARAYLQGQPDLEGLFEVDEAIDFAIQEMVGRYLHARDEWLRELNMREVAAAKQIEQAREMLIAVLGHDLRNPLNAITMGAGLLEMSPRVDETDRRVVQRIASSAGRMERMIADVVDFAAVRLGGGLEVAPGPDDLTAIARQAFDEIVLANPGRRLSFQTKGDTTGLFDHDRILQVLSNLLGNSMTHGEDPILVSVEGDVAFVSVRVANGGEPIPPDLLPSLFEPFRRGDRRGSRGIGLGLYIAAQIVQAHRGLIEVNSDQNATTFTVRLPRFYDELG